MLRWRLLLGVILIAILAGLFWLDAHLAATGAVLLGLALVAAVLAAGEVVSLSAAGGYRPLAAVVYGGSLAVVASNALPLFLWPVPDERPLERLGWPAMAFALSVLLAWIGEMARYREPGKSMVNLALAVLGIAYVGLMLSFAVQLRLLGGAQSGLIGLVALIAVVKMCDTGAYTVGRLFGRHKMAPRISPGKTLEGAFGGLAFACLGAWVVTTWMPEWMGVSLERHPLGWVGFGLLVGAAGMAGDLAESLFKRDVGRKDSSTWMPGFGGVLDLLDSILFAAPVAYMCWLAGLR